MKTERTEENQKNKRKRMCTDLLATRKSCSRYSRLLCVSRECFSRCQDAFVLLVRCSPLTDLTLTRQSIRAPHSLRCFFGVYLLTIFSAFLGISWDFSHGFSVLELFLDMDTTDCGSDGSVRGVFLFYFYSARRVCGFLRDAVCFHGGLSVVEESAT